MSITVNDTTITSRTCVVDDEAHICVQVTTPDGLVKFNRSMLNPHDVPPEQLSEHERDVLNLAFVHTVIHSIDENPLWAFQWNNPEPVRDLMVLYTLVTVSDERRAALCQANSEIHDEVGAILRRFGVIPA